MTCINSKESVFLHSRSSTLDWPDRRTTRWRDMWPRAGTERPRSCWTGCTTTRTVRCFQTDIYLSNCSLSLEGCLLKCFYMWAEALNLWCFSSSWYLVSGVHYGRAAEGKGPFSRHWLYPLHAWKESTAAAAIFYPSRLQPSITSLKCVAKIKMCIEKREVRSDVERWRKKILNSPDVFDSLNSGQRAVKSSRVLTSQTRWFALTSSAPPRYRPAEENYGGGGDSDAWPVKEDLLRTCERGKHGWVDGWEERARTLYTYLYTSLIYWRGCW